MKTSLFIISLTISSFCLAQNSTDSTAIKNKQMIEALKNRIIESHNIKSPKGVIKKYTIYLIDFLIYLLYLDLLKIFIYINLFFFTFFFFFCENLVIGQA